MKKRYVTLDAMRGVAALAVVIRHFTAANGGIPAQFSYLAVDVFFVLSGFVLSLSYREQFDSGMTPLEFLKRRVIRLYPLYFTGITLGLAIEVAHGFLSGALKPGTFAALASTSLLMLPSPTWTVWVALFPAMVPGWSLFFELYVASGLFALVRGHLAPRLLVAVVVCSGAVLIVAAARAGSLDLGSTWPTFLGGFPRVCFSFFTGVMLQRLHRRHPPRTRMPSWLILVVLALVLSPTIDGRLGQLYEIACVFLIFPALIFWGAEAFERRPQIGALLGDLSYAVYVIHYPMVEIATHIQQKVHRFPFYGMEIAFILVVSTTAYVLHRYYDEPVRASIARWRAHRRRLPGAGAHQA